MVVYLNDQIEELDIEKALPLVSEQRRQEALRYRQQQDRRLSLAVYLLLCEVLKKRYGIIEPPQFAFGPCGKPMLADFPGIHFNLSHCSRAALCVVDKYPVGCDIEAVPENLDMDLCRYCFNDEEADTICSSPCPALAFTELWTRKEAFLKLTGQGLPADGLRDVMGSPLARKTCFGTLAAPDRSYVYSVCSYSSTTPSCFLPSIITFRG